MLRGPKAERLPLFLCGRSLRAGGEGSMRAGGEESERSATREDLK